MILYVIQAHERPAQVSKLISLLDDGEDRFLVNVDAACFDGFAAAGEAVPPAARSRTVVRRGMPVSWAGFSQVLSWLDVYRFALRRVPDWEFLVLLSGSCLPLRSPGRIRRHLLDGRARGLRVHRCRWGWERSAVGSTGSPALDQGRDQDGDQESDQDWAALGYRREHLLGRIDADIRADVFDLVTDPATTPLVHQERRGEIHCQDVMSEKKLVIRGLSAAERRRREALMARLPVRGGWMWAALARGAVSDLLRDPNLDAVLELLSTFPCADELLLPTLLRSSAAIGEHEVADGNLHFDQGFPAVLTDEDLDRLAGSEAMFCRKVDHAAQPELVAFAERRVAEEG